jgi:hypothetical protein
VSQHEVNPAEATHEAPSTAATPSSSPDAGWQRDISQRLAHGTTAQELGVYLSSHPEHRDEALAFLHQHRGNAFVQQVVAASSHGAPLEGAMLVSNNPEGLASPGTIMAARAKAGHLAAYVHHSNHMHAPLDLYVVVKPDKGPVTASISGASSSTGGGERAHGGSGDWASDPNVVVAAANTDPKANEQNRTNETKTANGATPIKIGTLPAAGKGDPPLFDARYQVDLGGDAELEIVAERGGKASANAAAADRGMATGNTKYELGGTNGRAAGIYEGASFASDDTVHMSKLPFKKPLTGSKFTSSVPTPKATEQQAIATPAAATLSGITKALDKSVDEAAAYALEHVFRIAPDWLREKGCWDGSHLTTKGLTDDYATIIGELKAALTSDRGNRELAATKQVFVRHPTIGATLDAASYGTMFEVDALLDNDTKSAATVELKFLTDANAARANRPGAVYRGVVSVDGVDRVIDNDTAHHLPSSASLGDATVEPGQSKYVHVHFQSPGQISAGQELDIEKKK